MGSASINLPSRADLDYIHNATLGILENPGLEVPSKRARIRKGVLEANLRQSSPSRVF